MSRQETLTKNEVLALRGLCISLIVLHNLIHNIVPIHEKWFNPDNAHIFLDKITNSPILGTLAYAGWMGVPIFFFLSGFGLTQKYGYISDKSQFIKNHYIKILLIFGPIIIINNIHASTSILSIIRQLTFIDPVQDFVPAAF